MSSDGIQEIRSEPSPMSFGILEIPQGDTQIPNRISATLNRFASIPIILTEIPIGILQRKKG